MKCDKCGREAEAETERVDAMVRVPVPPISDPPSVGEYRDAAVSFNLCEDCDIRRNTYVSAGFVPNPLTDEQRKELLEQCRLLNVGPRELPEIVTLGDSDVDARLFDGKGNDR